MLRMRFVWMVLFIGSLALSGCQYLPALDEVLPDKRKEYEKSESLPDLEVPPNLSSDSIADTMAVPDVDETGTATFSTYQERTATTRAAQPALGSDKDETASASKDYLTGQAHRSGAASEPEGEPPQPQASGAERAALLSAGDGKKYLLLSEEFESAWRRMEGVLAQAGLKMEDEDVSRGIYYIRHGGAGSQPAKKKGLLSRLAFWSDDEEREYQLSLTGVDGKTEVVVLDDEGNWEDNEAATQILTALAKELNK